MATHKESSYGGQRDEDEDAVRMGVETKILCYIAGSVVTLVKRNVLYIHSFLPQIIMNSLLQPRIELRGLMVLRANWMRQS